MGDWHFTTLARTFFCCMFTFTSPEKFSGMKIGPAVLVSNNHKRSSLSDNIKLFLLPNCC